MPADAEAAHAAAPRRARRALRVAGVAACALLLLVTTLLYFAARWYLHRYGRIGFDSVIQAIVFHAQAAEEGQIRSFLVKVVLRTALVWPVLCIAVFGAPAAVRRLGRATPRWTPLAQAGLALAISGVFLFRAVRNAGLDRWLADRAEPSTLYEERYVDPRDVEVSFPEKKRNLVCLYLESCETTFFSCEQGGAMEECVIPELYEMARSGINFSQNDGVGGSPFVNGAAWTTGAMVALTMGIPLSLPVKMNTYDQYRDFLPGARALGEILRDAGYRQTLLVGSDASFGGRDKLYSQHGVENILDVFTAERDGIIPPGYRVWWGFEDRILYGYARREISRLAAEPGPFAITILTVDTHGPEGFVCNRCGNRFAEPYENVFACASRQAAEFVAWLREQPFWEDTTVFVCGDHLSMNPAFFRRAVADHSAKRRVYNCLLNPAPGLPSDRQKRRAFMTMDFFPTVLSALGCTIPGDRLGLGTNLFSDRPTLGEEMGIDRLNAAIRKHSDFYFSRLVLGR